MSELVAKSLSRGDDIVRFDIGEPDFETPLHIKEAAIEAIRHGFTHYTSARGIPELRDALIADVVAKGMDAKMSNISVYPGSKFGIFSVLSLLVDEGDEVIVQDPGWPTYASQVEFLGGTPVRLKPKDDQDCRGLPIELFEDAISERTKAAIINSPCNPTGARFSQRQLDEVLALTSRKNVVLLLDRIYSALVYDEAPDRIPTHDLEGNDFVVTSGFSKEFAMTGWRLGYTLASTSLTDQLVKFQDNTTTCAPSFVQKAAVAGLTGDRAWQDEMNREYKERRDVMVGEIDHIQGWSCSPPAGAFYCFPRVSMSDSASLASTLLARAKVSSVAGIFFGPSGERHLRLSFTTPKSRIVEGMRRIREHINTHSNVMKDSTGGDE
jgi:aspartate aminotransferase